MMRKDVKLGLAIGGVLLAVLVVYVLVGTGGDRNVASNGNTAGIVTEDKSKPPTNVAKAPESVGNEVGGTVAGLPGSVASTDPAVASNSKPVDPASQKDPNSDLWGTALNEGRLMLTQTPDPTNARPASDTQTSDTPGGGNPDPAGNSLSTRPGNVEPANRMEASPSTQPAGMMSPRATDRSAAGSGVSDPSEISPANNTAGGKQRSHVVQKGETLARIAQMAYGNANYFPAIQRANPNLDPKKLKPGMTIILPAINDVKRDATGSAEPASATVNAITSRRSGSASIDPKTQYRVESGDTLERIAMKLYGKREMIQKLQELNKDQLPDANKLKLNMVLKLPEPPTRS